MPRLARLVFGGVPYHVTQRGNRQGLVFFTDDDRKSYLGLLKDYAAKHSIEVLAYCLMTNHVHLVLVPDNGPDLHRALKPVHMRHAQRINRLHGWKGHLWQGRYFSSALDDAYLWAAIRYVERNPVRAGIVNRAEQYCWSSAAAHCGLAGDPLLTSSDVWRLRLAQIRDWTSWLGAGDDEPSLKVLRQNVNKGLPCGAPKFVERLESATGRNLAARPQGRPRRGVRKG